eukprot:COSAG06_NODE_8709_length_2091_cov_2.224900_1_plen_76_part_10
MRGGASRPLRRAAPASARALLGLGLCGVVACAATTGRPHTSARRRAQAAPPATTAICPDFDASGQIDVPDLLLLLG